MHQMIPGLELPAPPRVLTMDEYQAQWKPQGWELIIIGPTSTWRQDWGEWEAIRDIVQNALDECEYYKWGYDERGLYIRDVGKGVAVADFLLGPPKLKPAYARGRFGEGMKSACLALIRDSYPVHVETVSKELWVVFLAQKVDGTAETLAAMWRPYSRRTGTIFHIIGYTGSAFENRFAVNLPKSAILWETPSPITTPVRRYNQLFDASLIESASIYARDIWMKDIKSPFTYNVWGFEMAPDRYGPKNEGDMWTDMGRLWSGVGRVDLLEKFLQLMCEPARMQGDESYNLRMGHGDMGNEPTSGKPYADFIKDNASAWQSAWRNVFGDSAVIRTTDRWDGTVKHLGYASVSLQWYIRGTLGQVITTDSNLVKASQARLREAQIIPDDRLTPRQLVHLKLARAIASSWQHPPVAGVYAAIIPPASDRVRTAGMYSKTTQEIFIASDQLESASTTVDTVIHEIAHHTSGAEDLEEAHSEAMTRVAARVVQRTAAKEFDELLKEAEW